METTTSVSDGDRDEKKRSAACRKAIRGFTAAKSSKSKKRRTGSCATSSMRREPIWGQGFYNAQSLIRVRIVSQNANDGFDEAFWRRRIGYSLDYRRIVMGEDFGCCRLIFGEADHFPGWTVDRFGPVLVSRSCRWGSNGSRISCLPCCGKKWKNAVKRSREFTSATTSHCAKRKA